MPEKQKATQDKTEDERSGSIHAETSESTRIPVSNQTHHLSV